MLFSSELVFCGTILIRLKQFPTDNYDAGSTKRCPSAFENQQPSPPSSCWVTMIKLSFGRQEIPH